jgi:hypothetical protein
MSTASTIATGARSKVTIGDESQFGTPVQPNYAIDFTSESLANEEETIESEQIHPHRGMEVMRKGAESVSGDISFELTAGGLGKLLKHALGEFVRLPNVDGGLHGRMETSEVLSISRSGSDDKDRVILPFTKDSVVGSYEDKDGQFLVVSETTSGSRSNDQLTPEGSFNYQYSGPSTLTSVEQVVYDSRDPDNQSDHAVRINISDVYDAETDSFVEPTINRHGGLLEVGHDRSQFPYYGVRENKLAVTADTVSESNLSTGSSVSPLNGVDLTQSGVKVLLTGQSNAEENGLWDTNGDGDPANWTRSAEFDSLGDEIDKNVAIDVSTQGDNDGETYVQVDSISSSGTLLSSIGGTTSGEEKIDFERDGLFIDHQDIEKLTSKAGEATTNSSTNTVTVNQSSNNSPNGFDALTDEELANICKGDIIKIEDGDSGTFSTEDNDDANVYVVVSVDTLNNQFTIEHINGGLNGISDQTIDFDVLNNVISERAYNPSSGETGPGEACFVHASLTIDADNLTSWSISGAPDSDDVVAGFDETKGNWIYQYDDQLDNVFTYHFKRARYVPEGLTIEVHRDAAAFIYSGCKVTSLSLTYDQNSQVTGTASVVGKSEAAMGELVLDADSNDEYVYVKDADSIVDPELSTNTGITQFFIGIGERNDIQYVSKTLVSDMAEGTDVDHIDGVKKILNDRSLDENRIYALQLVKGSTSAGDFPDQDVTRDDLNPEETDLDIFHPAGENVDALTTTAIVDSNGDPEVQNDGNVPLTSFESMVYFEGYFEEVLSADVTLENNFNEDKFGLGSREVFELPPEDVSVSGTVTVEFDDGKHYRKFKNGDKFAIELRSVEEGQSSMIVNDTCGPTGVLPQAYVFMPRCKLNGNTPNAEDTSYLEHDLPFTSLVDNEYNTTDMTIITVNSYGDDVEKGLDQNSQDSFS